MKSAQAGMRSKGCHVESMRRDGLVAGERLRGLFEDIEDQLIRYPAIHADQLRATVMDFCAEPA